MEQKLKNIFTFLNDNRKYNRALQERHYQSIILPYDNTKERVVSLLYDIANSQSQPKIDCLADFFDNIHEETSTFNSLKHFTTRLYAIKEIKSPNQPESPFNSLYNGMKSQSGWGDKTAALFTKVIYHLHNGEYSDGLKVWTDVPSAISKEDKLYLPVDTVIISIFNKLDSNSNWSFKSINEMLTAIYTTQQIEVWDDLWFWGFITQNGSGNQREIKTNIEKYWSLKSSDKTPEIIEKIKQKAEEFITTLESNDF